jgi:hypothetical protein
MNKYVKFLFVAVVFAQAAAFSYQSLNSGMSAPTSLQCSQCNDDKK